MSTGAAPADPRTTSPMTIGDVLALLRPEFPEVTVSKIRFLEAEGLIEPHRTPAGYRKFGAGDVARLRFILTAQRDRYLPLRVIREQLNAADERADDAADAPDGPRPADGPATTGRPRTLVAAATEAPVPPVRLTRRQLVDGAGIDTDLLDRMEEFGLVRRVGGTSGHYDGSALTVARVVAALGGHGLDVRHLRSLKAAADRQAALVEQLVAPELRRRAPGAHEAAAARAHAVAALAAELHGALVTAALRDSLEH